jgi:hypothetical protein
VEVVRIVCHRKTGRLRTYGWRCGRTEGFIDGYMRRSVDRHVDGRADGRTR